MVAKPMMPANMTIAQFIVEGTTGVAPGKKANTKIGARKQSAMMLMAMPHLPSEKRRDGRGCPRTRLMRRQEMTIIYDANRETVVRARTALRAAVDPMLMRESSAVTSRDTRTAFNGMFKPGVMCAIHLYPGIPRSRAKDQSCL
nr:hypothetical protein CFP56_20437 [Quercus suber]